MSGDHPRDPFHGLTSEKQESIAVFWAIIGGCRSNEVHQVSNPLARTKDALLYGEFVPPQLELLLSIDILRGTFGHTQMHQGNGDLMENRPQWSARCNLACPQRSNRRERAACETRTCAYQCT